MGRGKAVAGALSPSSVGTPSQTPISRAILRWVGGHARPDAGTSACQRRESAPHPLLPLAPEGTENRSPDGERRGPVLPSPGPLQRAAGDGQGRTARSGGAVLLPQSNG